MAKPKMKKPRNWYAVSAHFRDAYISKNARKEQSRKSCRTWKQKGKEDV